MEKGKLNIPRINARKGSRVQAPLYWFSGVQSSRTTLFTGQYPSLHGVTQTTGAAKGAFDPDVYWLSEHRSDDGRLFSRCRVPNIL
ncbi:hypothetical protein GCM10011391_03170 [Pullulanibacillus camelliae]|uniref:Uncharacterized protein n=1 Tax=Pullulanibacillus camelliae TaxID=1707096 RepID=A0A8J2VKB4_9BACL|nr:hypothetical protein GCM10011391_03170 [Pullulanibacillus camelliae]